ncbi:hypothetical protein ABL78_6334 [Leptomonas seymouri]|uniref:Uncharacterized protein n=1 Tax=Leptomonas seymouri TaxID=5684 RepID=A0A0N1I273_LEPSE|nr:hypothetical protein ABL78_6334 [Leptomonas seymouri]|eukprot:KPI84602.1 hypothetical protein ABL78_6334 [Leptomonas seymouri]
MASAIRFSRSQSLDSQAPTATTSSGDGCNAAAVHGRASQAFQHHEESTLDAAETSEVFQELPSSIPSAPSHPPSQRTKTTTSTCSKSRSESQSQSRRSTSQLATEAGRAGYPWGFYYPTSFPAAAAGAGRTSGQPPAPPERDSEGRHAAPRQKGAAPPHSAGTATFPFAVPNIPWIPPPPIHGISAPSALNVTDFFAPYDADPAAHPHRPFRQDTSSTAKKKGATASNAAFVQPPMRHPRFSHPINDDISHGHPFYPRRPAAAREPPSSLGLGWPTPDQLPLPSVFPMPPRVLPPPPNATPPLFQPPGSGRFDLFPPPPLPPWWFLQAIGCPVFPHSDASPDSSSSDGGSSCSESDEERLDGEGEAQASSHTSSPSPQRREGAVPYTPPYQGRPQNAFVAPIGSVETPRPMLPRGVTGSNRASATNRSSDDSMKASVALHTARRGEQTKQKATGNGRTAVSQSIHSVSRRAPLSSEDTASAYGDHRQPRKATNAQAEPIHRQRRSAPPASTPQTHVNSVSAAAEEREEAEDRRLQHVLSTAESYLTRIEHLYQNLRHRYESMLQLPVKGTEQSADGVPAQDYPTSPAYGHEDHDRGGIDNYLPPYTPQFTQHYAAAPTQPPSHAPSSASYNAAAPAPTVGSPLDRLLPSQQPTSASQSLRHELAMLESQWQRLEELKKRGIAVGAVDAQPNFSQQRFPSSLLATAEERTSSPQPSSGGDVFSNQSVMELINDRKRLLASAA